MNNIIIKAFVLVGFGVITILYCRSLLQMSYEWKDKYIAEKDFAEILTSNGVKKGYSSFWLGYPNEIYSNGNIVFGSVDIAEASLIKQYSNCDDSAYEYIEGKSCVLFSQEEHETLLQTVGADYIVKLVGQPVDSFIYTNTYIEDLYSTTSIIVYIFDQDISARLTDGLRDGILNPREMSFNMCGSRDESTIHLDNGGIVHGPYKTIAPGSYKVTYTGKNLDKIDSDVVSTQDQDLIDYKIISRSDNQIIGELNIGNYIEDIQFYLTNNTEESADFYNVHIEQIN